MPALRRRGGRRSKITARSADRYVLYTESVQSVDAEIAFFTRVYRKANGRAPVVLREDFCGTAAISCDWVKQNPRNLAIGVDLDPEPLRWGREHYVSKLDADQRRRLTFYRENVLKVETPRVDVVAALNFSFCVFKKRAELMAYIRRCRSALKPGGILVMDIYGGPDSQKPAKEKTRFKGFTYVWDQAVYNPVTNEALNHIHFTFPDGTRMMKAFTYDWRLWTPAELREAMLDSGFSDARVYWEGTEKDGSGDGIFRERNRADVDDAWVAYIVGFK